MVQFGYRPCSCRDCQLPQQDYKPVCPCGKTVCLCLECAICIEVNRKKQADKNKSCTCIIL
jgi:hypothetical protein